MTVTPQMMYEALQNCTKAQADDSCRREQFYNLFRNVGVYQHRELLNNYYSRLGA